MYKGKVPEHEANLSNSRNAKKHQKSYLSKDGQELENIIKSGSLNNAHLLRKALSDHMDEYEIVDQVRYYIISLLTHLTNKSESNVRFLNLKKNIIIVQILLEAN